MLRLLLLSLCIRWSLLSRRTPLVPLLLALPAACRCISRATLLLRPLLLLLLPVSCCCCQTLVAAAAAAAASAAAHHSCGAACVLAG
jgi:hypothetical protein